MDFCFCFLLSLYEIWKSVASAQIMFTVTKGAQRGCREREGMNLKKYKISCLNIQGDSAPKNVLSRSKKLAAVPWLGVYHILVVWCVSGVLQT
jgi:hypothetical protein